MVLRGRASSGHFPDSAAIKDLARELEDRYNKIAVVLVSSPQAAARLLQWRYQVSKIYRKVWGGQTVLSCRRRTEALPDGHDTATE